MSQVDWPEQALTDGMNDTFSETYVFVVFLSLRTTQLNNLIKWTSVVSCPGLVFQDGWFKGDDFFPVLSNLRLNDTYQCS